MAFNEPFGTIVNGPDLLAIIMSQFDPTRGPSRTIAAFDVFTSDNATFGRLEAWINDTSRPRTNGGPWLLTGDVRLSKGALLWPKSFTAEYWPEGVPGDRRGRKGMITFLDA